MQHDIPPTGGIDWATDTNELCIVHADGAVLDRLNTTADAAGIRTLIQRLRRHDVEQVAIERSDGPLVEALLAAGLEVVVITPRQVHHLRARYGSAGNKDDRFDAYVLADTLRTDRARLQPLRPDSAQTLALRSAVRARTDLVDARIAICNQLRAHLRIVFPGAVGLFADLDRAISLAFLTRFPSAQRADWLSHRRLGAWLAANAYCGRTPTEVLGMRQEAARRRHGLRRRQPPRQPLGCRHLRPPPRRRQDPPARHPHPRPRLAARHLALLARPHHL